MFKKRITIIETRKSGAVIEHYEKWDRRFVKSNINIFKGIYWKVVVNGNTIMVWE